MNSKWLNKSALRLRIFFLFIFIIESSEGENLESEEFDCRGELWNLGYIPKYANGVKTTDIEVRYGNELIQCGDNTSFVETLSAPTLIYDLTDRCPYVTIIQFVPEAKAPTFLRWLVHNVPPEALRDGFSNGGTLIDKVAGKKQGFVKANYVIPSESTTNLEGYNVDVIFIYCQCSYIADTEFLKSKDRKIFDVKAYVREQGLKCPVVGFYHYSTPT